MQVEYATDLVFRPTTTMQPLYEALARQAILTVKAEQVARKMSEFETSKEEATIEVASQTPAAPSLASEGGTEAIMKATSVESTAPSSTNVVVESVKAGASAAQEAVADFLPAVGKNLRTLVYNGFYYASFGVTFSALTVASLVPTDNVMGKALADGAEAAKEVFRKQHDLTASGECGSTVNPASGEGMVAA